MLRRSDWRDHDYDETTPQSSPSSPSSTWSDLPRRLWTIVNGFPFVVYVLYHYPLTFFRGVHLLCAMEYANMMPSPDVAFVFVSMVLAYCMYLEQRTWKTLNLTALIFGFGTLLLRHLTTSQQGAIVRVCNLGRLGRECHQETIEPKGFLLLDGRADGMKMMLLVVVDVLIMGLSHTDAGIFFPGYQSHTDAGSDELFSPGYQSHTDAGSDEPSIEFSTKYISCLAMGATCYPERW